MNRSWFLDTRPAWPAKTLAFRKHLPPGSEFVVPQKDLAGLMDGTVGFQAVLGTALPINVADHVHKLFAYPYGCLEQTTSGLFPHVILNSDQMSGLGITTGSKGETEKKIRIGIQRLMEKQKSSGGFGLWSANSPEAFWLTAYVTDFLLHAREAGFQVPTMGLSRAVERLLAYVKRPGTVSTQLASWPGGGFGPK